MKKLIIGVVTAPILYNNIKGDINNDDCGEVHIRYGHIKWLKSENLEIITIPYYADNLKEYIKNINGLYFPSGKLGKKLSKEYYECCKKLFYMAIEENDKGNYFPIWGCCLGFELLIIIVDGNDNMDNLLTRFNSYIKNKNKNKSILCKIKLYQDANKSRLINGIHKTAIKNMTKKKLTKNIHALGISPKKFVNNKNLNDFFNIIGTSKDLNNKEFIAIIEGKKYPFYGVQWHPEVNIKFKSLLKFYINELKKNKTKIELKNLKKFKEKHTRKINCNKYNKSKCMIYWYKDNYKKCSNYDI